MFDELCYKSFHKSRFNYFWVGANTKHTNNTNLKIARETNEMQLQLWREQRDYDREMWNMENEYNSASAQRQRLEDAGLNPYLMMNGGDAGSASSLRSPDAPTMQRAVMENPANEIIGKTNSMIQAGAQIAQLGKQFAETRQIQAQTENMSIQNAYLAEHLRGQNYAQALGNRMLGDTYFDRRRQESLRTNGMAIQNYGNWLENHYKFFKANEQAAITFWAGERERILQKIREAELELTKENKRLTSAKVDEVIASEALKNQETRKLVYENDAMKEAYDQYKGYIKASYQFQQDLYGGTYDGRSKGYIQFERNVHGSPHWIVPTTDFILNQWNNTHNLP